MGYVLDCRGTSGYFVVGQFGHCRDTLRPLEAYPAVRHCRDNPSAVGHCRDALRLDTVGILCGYTHCTHGEENIDSLKSNSPTVRLRRNLF